MKLLEELVERIQSRLSDGAYPNEAAVSFAVVMPILRSLGWDDSDPAQVMPEYASGGRRVDFALCGAGRRPSLFIEVKGVGRSLDGDRQLFEYAFHEGIPLCLLTDGREWNFFLPSGQGDLPPAFRTVLSWNFPLMIPVSGEGGFREEVEVYGGADRLHSAPG